jgi:hypothetical protein
MSDDDFTTGYVPSPEDLAEMERVLDKPRVLFQGRLVSGRVKHGAFIPAEAGVNEELQESVNDDLKSFGQDNWR